MTENARSTRQTTTLVAVSFAVLIAAALFCAGAFALRNAQSDTTRGSGPFASAPLRAATHVAPSSVTVAPGGTAANPSTVGPTTRVDTTFSASNPDVGLVAANSIPTLQVESLPKVMNKYGMLHVSGAQYDGHRIYVDGALVGNGAGDYEVYCGRHAVRVGAASRGHVVVIPCGGDANL